MKKLLVVLLVLGVVAAIGYLLGTESGRTRRDDLLARASRACRSCLHGEEDEVDADLDG